MLHIDTSFLNQINFLVTQLNVGHSINNVFI